ncbi:MAG: phage tail sheath subtilisin-like domain-containing protein [Sandaracinaceae bacterium]
MVTFNEIPNPNRSPAAFAEFDPVGAPGQALTHVLLVGLRYATGGAPALSKQLIAGEAQGDNLFGVGAPLARMCRAFKRVNRQARLTAIGVDEPAGGTASAGEIALTGPATQDGILAVYVAGERVAVPVSNGDTATQVGDALVALLAADAQLPVTGVNTLGTVAITAKWKGVSGDEIDLAVNLAEEDETPSGVGVTITAMAGGVGAPDFSAAVAVFEETTYDTIVVDFTDSISLGQLEAEVATRWEATRMLDGHVMAAKRGDLGTLTAFGNAKNAPETTILGLGLSPTAPWIAAAQMAGRDAAVSHPALPREGLTLPDVVAPAPDQRFNHASRNLLLEDGISTFKVDAGGEVILDRLVTTYQLDTNGQPSETWRPLTRRRNASFLRLDWVRRIGAKYSRKMLADDGTDFDPGAPVVTPSTLKSEALAWFRERERTAHVEDFDAFRESLLAERPSGDAERIDVLMEPNLINELVTIATKIAFRV